MSRPTVCTFRLPKRNAPWPEYEDDSGWLRSKRETLSDDDPRFLRVVVTDGASESMLAGRWARHLVAVFLRAPEDLATKDGFAAAYQRAVHAWPDEVASYRREREERNTPVQWYLEPGLAKGAYATLLVAEFRCAADGRGAQWRAAAVGDSSLFQTRGDQLLRSFPFEKSTAFGNQPALLRSHGTDAAALAGNLRFDAGDLAPGDILLLATDALSAWILKSSEEGHRQWQALSGFNAGDRPGFVRLIAGLRERGELKNDDTTLVRVNAG